jgi:group I intron endonuclease
MKSYVYKITNNVNGKIYFGKTNNPLKRWKRYQQGYDVDNNAMLIRLAIKKFGIENFQFNVIAVFQTEEDAFLSERAFIISHETTNRKIGYNMNEGGIGGVNPCEAVRQKISCARKGKKISDNQRKKMFKLSELEVTQLISLFNDNVNIADIAKQLNCSKYVVTSTLTREGVIKKDKLSWTRAAERRVIPDVSKITNYLTCDNNIKDEIWNLYINHYMTAKEISYTLNITHASIRAEISRHWDELKFLGENINEIRRHRNSIIRSKDRNSMFGRVRSQKKKIDDVI